MKSLLWMGLASLTLLIVVAVTLQSDGSRVGAQSPAPASVQPVAPAAITATVQVGPGSTVFSPITTTIFAGDKVRWVWASNFHSTTSGACCTFDGNWDSGVHNVADPPGPPHTFDFTFNTPGTYPYFCSIHGPFGMTGVIIVVTPRLHIPLVIR